MLTFAPQMRQLLHVTRMLALLGALALTVFTHWQGEEAVPPAPQECQAEPSVMAPQRHQHQEATLTDATQLFRVCGSRPQRLIPTHGSKPGRPVTSFRAQPRVRIVPPLHSPHDSRCRLETAPHSLSASCDYYVIALRHIIR